MRVARCSSLAFSRENDSCNTNRPSTSVVTIIKNDSHMHVRVPSEFEGGVFSKKIWHVNRCVHGKYLITGHNLCSFLYSLFHVKGKK